MKVEVGIDVVEIERFKKAKEEYKDRFLNRIFTEREIRNLPSEEKDLYLCINFSFKEAVWKSLPENLQKRYYFKDIEIGWKDKKPYLLQKPDNMDFSLSFSVSGNYVFTVCVAFILK